MKIHLCCGDIYLHDYLNIDIKGKKWIRSKEKNPNLTTIENYYRDRKIGERKTIYVDKLMNLTKKWTIKDNSVDEILMICAIEHFTYDEAKFILKEAKRILKKGGKFLLDYPDLEKTFEKYYKSNPEYYMRLVYCNHKDPYSSHKWGYTKDMFEEIAKDWSKIEFEEIVEHSYPMQGVILTK